MVELAATTPQLTPPPFEIGDTENKRPWRILIYGVPGIGKSTLAAHAPNHLFLDLEDGLRGVPFQEKMPKDRPLSGIDELVKALDWAKTDACTHDTIIIDTVSILEEWMNEKVVVRYNSSLKKDSKPASSIADIGYGKEGQYLEELWHQFIFKRIIPLNAAGKNVILVAHSQVVTTNEPLLSDPYQHHSCKLHKKSSPTLAAHMDGVFFCRTEMHVKKNSETKKNSGVEGDRMVYTSNTAGWLAKNRFQMPPEMVLDGKKFFEYITKE